MYLNYLFNGLTIITKRIFKFVSRNTEQIRSSSVKICTSTSNKGLDIEQWHN